MKKTFFLLGCLLSLNVLMGQTPASVKDTVKVKSSNYFGMNGGITTGLGLSYTHCLGKDGLQITFLPLFDKDVQKYSFALTYLRYFTTDENVNFLMFVGNHLTNLGSKSTIYNIGVGPGIESGSDNLKVRFMIGYGILNIPDNIMSRPTAELGFFYKF